ncbi:C45 family autoproteolytic acyltransferase/hydolase [uncultured Ruminococcus sp.]|uniref:C45 family autoproteolytic acyltransferase/hydolase n=1 Tax=uncultured Ruminococcus sp. TaxID=165186 RepID=UPI002624C861|nr:C45 family autoproteolytic acyltransferase/hydolase [uncultured Ruminococcus sp.]
MKRLLSAAAALVMAATAAGCGHREGYESFVIPVQGGSTLKPVDDCYMETNYQGVAPTKEKVKETFASSDGLCRIDVMESYYDVTLDYEKGTPKEVGAAYAETLLLACPEYHEICEPYIYENIKAEFSNLNGDYSSLKNRAEVFYEALDEEYRQELDGLTEKIKGDSEGFVEDGILSRDEVILMQFIPDALRGTACSAISADGAATASGERITCRLLEWILGSENQICRCHSVVHMKNGSKSFVSVSYLGFMTILTAVNREGLMLGELDVGSRKMVKYTCEDKKSYTYGMRYALENFGTAREAAGYLAANADSYPYCVNVLATDRNEALIAELSVTEEDGETVIRDSSTKLKNGIEWDDPNYVCAVNAFASDGNSDFFTGSKDNTIRWNRYNELFCGQKGLTLDRFKELMTCEKSSDKLILIRSEGLVHMVIADYSTGTLQAVFTGTEGVIDSPEFIDLGSWK